MKAHAPPIAELKNYEQLQSAALRLLGKASFNLPAETFQDVMCPPATLSFWLAGRSIKPAKSVMRIAIVGAESFDASGHGAGYLYLPYLAGLSVKETHIILIGPRVKMEHAYQHIFPGGIVQCHPVRQELRSLTNELIVKGVDAAFLFNPGFGSNNTPDATIYEHHNSLLEDESLKSLSAARIPIGATAFTKQDALADIRQLKGYGFKPTKPARNPWGLTYPRNRECPGIVPSWSLWMYDIA